MFGEEVERGRSMRTPESATEDAALVGMIASELLLEGWILDDELVLRSPFLPLSLSDECLRARDDSLLLQGSTSSMKNLVPGLRS